MSRSGKTRRGPGSKERAGGAARRLAWARGIRLLAGAPWNREGADKTYVLLAADAWRENVEWLRSR